MITKELLSTKKLLSNRVGKTPLVKITDKIWAKAEFLNPSGSLKDRMATQIINHAEENGLISKGDTIIEATSGNAGISFAWLAAERGYRIKIVMPCNMSVERKQILKYYGAELIEVEAGNFDGAISLRDKLSKENGWFNPNQFSNSLNIEAHFENTSVEILEQISSKKLSAFVSGTGTGGTIMGCQKRFSTDSPDTKIVAVEPLESPVMSGGEPGLHGIQGIGDGSKFLVDLNLIDKIYTVSTQDSKNKALELAKNQGLFVGISSGANIIACEKFIEEFNPDGIVVTILCDRGDRYLSCF
jgi:cysteine synthase A